MITLQAREVRAVAVRVERQAVQRARLTQAVVVAAVVVVVLAHLAAQALSLCVTSGPNA